MRLYKYTTFILIYQILFHLFSFGVRKESMGVRGSNLIFQIVNNFFVHFFQNLYSYSAPDNFRRKE